MTVLLSRKSAWGFVLIVLIGLILVGGLTAVSSHFGLLFLSLPFILAVSLIAFYRPYWVVLFLAAFLPFEIIILKFLPVSDQLYLLAQLSGEMLIYLTFLLFVVKKFLQRQFFVRTPLDIPILLFLAIVLITMIVNQPPLVSSLLNVRTLIRYIFLFYLVVNLHLSSQQVSRILQIILIIGAIQLFIGGLQRVGGTAVNQILLPREANAELAGQARSFILASRGREIGSIYGTLGDTIYYAYFLLFVLAIHLGRIRKFNLLNIIFILGIFLAINLSFSRAAVFGFLFLMIILVRSRIGLNRSLMFVLTTVPYLFLIVFAIIYTANETTFINPVQQEQSIFENIGGVFTRRYFEIAQKQRLGHLLGAAPTILANRPFIGYGPDEETTIDNLNNSDPSYLIVPLKGRTANTFEDVFWVALLGYYGIFGVGLIAFIIYRFYHVAWQISQHAQQHVTRELALATTYTMALAPVLLFFNQTLEFRIYGFYFWLLPAMLFSQMRKEKSLIQQTHVK